MVNDDEEYDMKVPTYAFSAVFESAGGNPGARNHG
jgi:hypothetical protein